MTTSLVDLSPEQVHQIVSKWKPDAQAAFVDQLKAAKDYRPFYCPNRNCSGFPHVIARPDPTEPCIDPDGSNPHLAHAWVPPVTPDSASPADVRRYRRQMDGTEAIECARCEAIGYAAKPGAWLHYHARADQHPPPWTDDWLLWLILSGRGSGKTFSAANLVNKVVWRVPILTLIGVTGPTMRRDMIEGPSGIIACSPPDNRPLWEPSKQQITWPNGAVAHCVSAEEPDRLRGMNSGFIWLDEPAHMTNINEVWDQALLTLRQAAWATKVLATTTPKPIEWVRKRAKDPQTVVTQVSTYANLHTLSKTFRSQVLDLYEGTLTGEQELHGKILEGVEGTLWTEHMIVHAPADVELPEFDRVVTGVDPAGSTSKRSDETGIVTVGVAKASAHDLTAGHPRGPDTDIFWVLAVRSGKYSPSGWAKAADEANDEFAGDAIVAEKNFGGDMVRHTLETSNVSARVLTVNSRHGKRIRAEPVVGLYETGRVIHVRGLQKLENQQCSWVPGTGASPNDIDALVHAITELRAHHAPSEIASPHTMTF